MGDMNTTNHSVDFSQHWMAWLAIRHFLPARLLRELASTVVRQATNGRLALDQLFEEVSRGESVWDECWMVRPRALVERPARDAEREYYVRVVRALVWQNDETGWPELSEKTESRGGLSPQLIDAIMLFGAADFGWRVESINRRFEAADAVLQESFKCLLTVFKVAQENRATSSVGDLWCEVASTTEAIDMPLRAVMMKHVADWCADEDAWDKALFGYERAGELLAGWKADAGWEDVASAWAASVLSSRAAALGIIDDSPATAAGVLGDALRDASLEKNPVLVNNTSFDALVMSFHPRVEGGRGTDNRVAMLLSPLLNDSHDPYSAMSYWLRGKYADATRRFWALLRRQLALGAAADCRSTKVWYARSIIDELSEALKRDVRPEAFLLAVRMLVESGNEDAIARILWQEALLVTYVDYACVEMVISHANAFPGSRIGREQVVVELFKEWVPRLAPTRREVAVVMWKHIAALAKEFKAEFHGSVDLGRPSLKALQVFAEKSPELRAEVVREVQEAICYRLHAPDEFWAGASEACETARCYSDVFDAESMALVIGAVVDRLKALDPETDLYPVTRPALTFLVDSSVKKHVAAHPEAGKGILDQILRFGLEQESEHRMLFFYLYDFDASLLRDADVRGRMKDAVEHVRSGARQLNSSNVIDNIKALLLAPWISGRDGVADALDSLKHILESAGTPRESVGLSFGYDPLLLLLDLRKEIEAALPGHEEWLRTRYDELLARLPGLWKAAAVHPMLFAAYSFPPRTKSDPVIIHNWAFASIRWAEEFGRSEQMNEALREASANPEIAAAIALARSTRSVARAVGVNDLDEVRTSDRDAFYTAIGRRLAQVKTNDDARAAELCKVLIEQCFRFGPREIDAAVLLEAARLSLHNHVRNSGMQDYAKRLEGDRDRRLVLMPIVDLFIDKSRTEG